MKILLFGLGSIGKRHADILREKKDVDLIAYRSTINEEYNEFGIPEIYSWDEIKAANPQVAFITNPTFLHIDTALKCADLGMKLFIEKPIGYTLDGLNNLVDVIREKDLVSYVAYNLRFHPVLERLKEYLKGKEILHVNICNSSFLPAWRPYKWHMDSYSSKSEKGGGVILDLSHEFDYIKYLFGDIDNIEGKFGKVSDVTKDAEDFLDASIKVGSFWVNLHINFFSMHTERTIKIDCKDEFIRADLINGGINFFRKDSSEIEQYDHNITVSYRRQIDYFLQNIDNTRMMNNLIDASDLFRKIILFKENKK